MRKPVFLLTLPLAALLMAPVPARALELPDWVPLVGKKKTPTAIAATSSEEAEANAEFQRGEGFENQGDTKEALGSYRRIAKLYSLTAAAPKAQVHIGRILERAGAYKDAYDAYTVYTTKYPRGNEFDAVIQSQFTIAKLFLDGQKKKVLGISINVSGSEAEKMFAGIVQRAPFHKLAPLAQFNVGQALEKQGKSIEAMGAYQAVLTRYPNDPIASNAQYQMGFVQFRETKEGSRDQAARVKARESFEDFTVRYPQSEKIPQAQENIKALSGTDVKATLDTAKFYDKTKNYKAAVIYYNDVIRVAPGTPESEASRARIEELKGLVGVDALRAGPEKAQSGDIALTRRRALAKVDVAARPDYNGPPIDYPYPPLASRPNLRTTPVGPIVEPPLPGSDPLAVPPGSIPATGDPLLTPPASPDGTAKPGTLPELPKPPDEKIEAEKKKPAKDAQ
jgi:outer membrane protein assembly factor BamD